MGSRCVALQICDGANQSLKEIQKGFVQRAFFLCLLVYRALLARVGVSYMLVVSEVVPVNGLRGAHYRIAGESCAFGREPTATVFFFFLRDRCKQPWQSDRENLFTRRPADSSRMRKTLQYKQYFDEEAEWVKGKKNQTHHAGPAALTDKSVPELPRATPNFALLNFSAPKFRSTRPFRQTEFSDGSYDEDDVALLASKQNQCWSFFQVPPVTTRMSEKLNKNPPQENHKEAQRQAVYQKRLYRTVQTSRSPRLTVR